jgi:CheY-like chemotaxis protein
MAKVLIVEDDALLTRMYSTILGRHNHQVVAAADGQEGVTAARKEAPDLILLDIMMPKFNGLQALDQLKKDPKTAGIPVVVLTNLSNVNNAQDVLARGADKFVDKALFEPKNLGALVEEMSKVKAAKQAAQGEVPAQGVQTAQVEPAATAKEAETEQTQNKS